MPVPVPLEVVLLVNGWEVARVERVEGALVTDGLDVGSLEASVVWVASVLDATVADVVGVTPPTNWNWAP